MLDEVPIFEDVISDIFLDENQIQDIVFRTAEKMASDIISNNYNQIIIMAILSGAKYFSRDLEIKLKEIISIKYPDYKLEIHTDSITVKSYQGTQSKEIKVVKDHKLDIENKIVYLAEDILDTGKSIDFTLNHLKTKKPQRIRPQKTENRIMHL